MRLKFTKMHGLGNHFMVVDLLTQSWDLNPGLIRQWGIAETGVGFDQFLAILPPTDPDADFLYRIFNTDGSEAEQCGNGARCFAKFIYDNNLSVKPSLILQTNTGRIEVSRQDDSSFRVDMGVPELEPARVPFVSDSAELSYSVETPEATINCTAVSMGNPHAVVFVDDIASAPVEQVGTALQAHERFPESVNVGFLQVIDPSFARLRVFERGVGETKACGTGACAAMVAGHLHGRLNSKAKISLPGGKLRVWWKGENTPVSMLGPATTVFEGVIDL